MPETYKIHLMPAVGDEVAAHILQLFQPSQDDPEIYELVDQSLIANLTSDPEGDPDTFYWTSVLADAAKAWKIVALSSRGKGRNDEVAHLPRPANANTFTVEVLTINAGLGIKQGVMFYARPKEKYAVSGDRLIIDKGEDPTDEDGHASLTLSANCGTLKLILGEITVEVDTTDRQGQVINFKDLL